MNSTQNCSISETKTDTSVTPSSGEEEKCKNQEKLAKENQDTQPTQNNQQQQPTINNSEINKQQTTNNNTEKSATATTTQEATQLTTS